MRQAAQKNDYIRGILAGYRGPDGQPLSNSTLWRRCKAVCPGLSRKTMRYVFKLTSEHKRQRLSYCRRLMGMGACERNQYLSRVVWIDSKKMYIAPESKLVYANSSAQLYVQDRRVPCKGGKRIVYYAAVNTVFGIVDWVAATGTSRDRNPDGTWWYATTGYRVSGWRAASKP
jgi:hypothetical protein